MIGSHTERPQQQQEGDGHQRERDGAAIPAAVPHLPPHGLLRQAAQGMLCLLVWACAGTSAAAALVDLTAVGLLVLL